MTTLTYSHHCDYCGAEATESAVLPPFTRPPWPSLPGGWKYAGFGLACDKHTVEVKDKP